VNDKVAGFRKSGKREKEPRQKKRDKRSRQGVKKKRGEKKGESRERRRRRSSIYHPAKWTGLETSRLEAPAPLGHSLQFLTIRLDQPPYKETYYVATLRRDSHGRSNAR